jgi:hypothetical protein
MSDTKQATCAERIRGQMDRLKEMLTLGEIDEGDILGIDRTETIGICLSWGGPSEYVELDRRDGDVIAVRYRFSDWFDTAVLDVDESNPIYQWALDQLDYLG